MWTYRFWLDALERSVRSAASAVLSVWLVGDVALDFWSLDWRRVAGTALGAAAISLLMSLAATQVTVKGTASFLPEASASPGSPKDTGMPGGKNERGIGLILLIVIVLVVLVIAGVAGTGGL